VGVRATVTLSAQWLVEVWARGLAVVDGGLVLAVEREASTGDPRLAVQAVRWDPVPDPGRPGRFGPVTATAVVEPGAERQGPRLVWAAD
ncbi:MAG: hypothetical protein ACRDZW_08180, partial [Acidimicrobiales bacterium]